MAGVNPLTVYHGGPGGAPGPNGCSGYGGAGGAATVVAPAAPRNRRTTSAPSSPAAVVVTEAPGSTRSCGARLAWPASSPSPPPPPSPTASRPGAPPLAPRPTRSRARPHSSSPATQGQPGTAVFTMCGDTTNMNIFEPVLQCRRPVRRGRMDGGGGAGGGGGAAGGSPAASSSAPVRPTSGTARAAARGRTPPAVWRGCRRSTSTSSSVRIRQRSVSITATCEHYWHPAIGGRCHTATNRSLRCLARHSMSPLRQPQPGP